MKIIVDLADPVSVAEAQALMTGGTPAPAPAPAAAPAPAPAPAPAAQAYTQADVSNAIAAFAGKHGAAACKAKLSEMGLQPNATAIPPEHYANVVTALAV